MSLRTTFWTACRAPSPDLHLTLKSVLGAWRSRVGERRSGQVAYTRDFVRRLGPAVLGGSFQGLRFPSAAFDHNLVSKLTGVYECQLHACVETLIGCRPARIVDIGSAEGCCANGLALRLPEARVHAFDAAPGERAVCRRVASANGLTARVTVHGICKPEVEGWTS